tara:strand:- start:303 stop:680 length:378 start_codon:yes stop_codon:yes gene_type:complete
MSLVESKGVSGTVSTLPTQPPVDTSSIVQQVQRATMVVISRECAGRFPNFNKIVRYGTQGIEAVQQMTAMSQGQAMNMFTGQPSMVGAAQQLSTQPVADPKVAELESKVTAMESKIDLLLERIPA